MLVMFYFSFFSPTVLRVPSTDRPETLPPDRNLRVFYNASPLQTLIANISGTAKDIQNRPTLQTMAIPPAFNEKGPVNFGPLTA